ncbi:MAG: PP2C family protein-serine/threonine phosphatase [Terriglobales bacterium]
MYTSKLVGMAELEPGGASVVCNCRDHAREAKLIQASLVPAKGLCHESVEIAFRFVPLLEVGGDFADFFLLPDGMIGIYLGDVVGKGLPAAMYSALVMGVLRGIHKTGTDTANVLMRLNQRLVQRPIVGRFCSTLYVLFNPATRELIFSNAGMELPLLAAGATCQELGGGGLPSGMFPGATYERHVVQLAPGDCVLFATDGLHDARNRVGIEFRAAQMKEIWAQCRNKSATESVDFLFDRLLAFSGERMSHDDITAVVLKVLP